MVNLLCYDSSMSTESTIPPPMAQQPVGQLPKIAAVVLAGDRDEVPDWVEAEGSSHKLLVPLVDKPMISWVLETLQQCPNLETHRVACHHPSLIHLAQHHGFQVIPSGASGYQTLLNAVHSSQGYEWVLCVSGDHALITPEMVDYFIAQSLAQSYDIAVAVASRQTVQSVYPDAQRTYFPFLEGQAFTGANMFLVNRNRFFPHANDLAMFEQNRKFQWRCLSALSPLTALGILLRQWSIHEVAQRLSSRFGCRLGAIEMPQAEAAIDIDKKHDHILGQHILENRILNTFLAKVAADSPVEVEEPQPWFDCCSPYLTASR